MLKSFKAFEKSLDEIMKLRSRNYVNTDCNISLLLGVTYTEIATEIVLEWDVYDFDLTSSMLVYNLPKTNNPANDSESTKRYESIYDIADTEGNDISGLFKVNTQMDELTISHEDVVKFEGLNVRILPSVLSAVETL